MYIPMKREPQKFQNYIKMIYSLDPLQTVWVDPNTGEVEDRTNVTTKLQSSGKTLGTSALIPFSFNGTSGGSSIEREPNDTIFLQYQSHFADFQYIGVTFYDGPNLLYIFIEF